MAGTPSCRIQASLSTRNALPGYVGLSMAFAFAVAALITGEDDVGKVDETLGYAACALTCGIALELVGLLRTRMGRLVVLGSS